MQTASVHKNGHSQLLQVQLFWEHSPRLSMQLFMGNPWLINVSHQFLRCLFLAISQTNLWYYVCVYMCVLLFIYISLSILLDDILSMTLLHAYPSHDENPDDAHIKSQQIDRLTTIRKYGYTYPTFDHGTYAQYCTMFQWCINCLLAWLQPDIRRYIFCCLC